MAAPSVLLQRPEFRFPTKEEKKLVSPSMAMTHNGGRASKGKNGSPSHFKMNKEEIIQQLEARSINN